MNTFFSWRSAFMDSNLQATTKHILHVISTYMNSHGEGAFPTLETIAKKSNLSLRAVKKHIPLAVEAGWIIKEKHGFAGKQWPTNSYKISFPNNLERSGARGALTDDDVVHEVPQCGARGALDVVHEVHTITPSNSPKNTPIKNIKKDFDDFYKIYPRKKGKRAAFKKFQVVRKDVEQSELIDGLRKYNSKIKSENIEEQFIAYPATWLNQGRWEDEYATTKRPMQI